METIFKVPDLKEQLKKEHEQLLSTWRYVVNKNTFGNLGALHQKFFQSTERERASVLRGFHDKLGFVAFERNADLKHCCGTLYRTTSFIRENKRNGSRSGQTVHIEHTVPIVILCKHLSLLPTTRSDLWIRNLLRFSVTTAFSISEKSFLIGRSRTTDALTPSTNGFCKPFLRYEKLYEAGHSVWNVLTKQPIDIHYFTFDHHIENLLRLLKMTNLKDESLPKLLRDQSQHQHFANRCRSGYS